MVSAAIVLPQTPCLLYTSDAADDLTRVDLGGRFGDRPLNPISWQDEAGTTEMLISDGIQTRAQLLGMESKSVGDPYVLMRSAYEQRRRYQINDGIVVDLFLDDPVLDDPSAAQ